MVNWNFASLGKNLKAAQESLEQAYARINDLETKLAQLEQKIDEYPTQAPNVDLSNYYTKAESDNKYLKLSSSEIQRVNGLVEFYGYGIKLTQTSQKENRYAIQIESQSDNGVNLNQLIGFTKNGTLQSVLMYEQKTGALWFNSTVETGKFIYNIDTNLIVSLKQLVTKDYVDKKVAGTI